MAGYKRKPTLYKLTWEDEPGFEVSMRSVPVGTLLDLMGMADALEGGDPEMIRTLMKTLAGCIVSWNLEDDAGPVPVTAEGLMAQDTDLLMKILSSWTGAMSSADNPLPPAPAGPGPEAGIPMAPLPGS